MNNKALGKLPIFIRETGMFFKELKNPVKIDHMNFAVYFHFFFMI